MEKWTKYKPKDTLNKYSSFRRGEGGKKKKKAHTFLTKFAIH